MKKIPTGSEVSEQLQEQIIALLRKYAGADNPRFYKWSLTAMILKNAFAEYLDKNPYKLFGKVKSNGLTPSYYPLCMYFYYNNNFPNKAMFKLNDELLPNASNEIPSPEMVMEWFYEKHKNELIGLL